MMRHLEGNFFGQIKRGNKRFDIPLYMLHTRLKLSEEMGRGNRYYTLAPEVATDTHDNGVLPKDWVMGFKNNAEQAKKMQLKDMDDMDPEEPKPMNQPDGGEGQGGENGPPPVGKDDVPF
jgi:hypothetical protein